MSHSTPSHQADRPLARRELLALGAVGFVGCAGAHAPGAKVDANAPVAPDVAELFADLRDQSGTVEPIQPAERAARRQRAGELLAAAKLDALVVEPGATLRYLANVPWWTSERLFALVVLADGSHFWLTPRFEAEKALLKLRVDPLLGEDLVTWDEHEYAWKPLAAELARRGVERVAIDPAARYFVGAKLAAAFGGERVALGDAVVGTLRGCKDAHELAILRRANELTQQAIVAASRHVRPGLTGARISELIQGAQRKLGLTGTWDLSLVGPHAALPHGDNQSAVLARDQLVLVDTGGDLHGYKSDITRTWVGEGRAGPEELRAWRAVHDAQRRAFEAIRPGVTCSAIDRVARESLTAAGFGPGYAFLTHRLGHGIGLEGHEDPYFDGGSDVLLRPGMTLSDEPGVYVLERYGVRLEDIVVVTADGADHFGGWQQDPSSPA